ncbi:MAG TPA: Hsp20/alpha crystallin family protein [Kofleriaceae bacterium]|jgi:HSP20 family protein
MSLVLRNDPFSFARDLLDWHPFVSDRAASAFAPAFEVKETADAFVLKADVPGVADKDLDVAIHDGVLTVRGSRGSEQHAEGERYSVYERRFGSFSRSFALPDVADTERIEAKLDGGVLTLTIGKKSETKPKKIEIRK